jgi:hypothetical protein
MSEDIDNSSRSDPANQPASTGSGPSTVRHSWEQSDQPSVAIIEAVAAATGREIADLPSLQRNLEADALDTLLGGQPPGMTVSFMYAGTNVSVSGDGTIEVQIREDSQEGNDK